MSNERQSDISGKGHGDAHLWHYENSNDTGHSFYVCLRCRAGFCHAYRRVANIFEAMEQEGVPLVCEALQTHPETQS